MYTINITLFNSPVLAASLLFLVAINVFMVIRFIIKSIPGA